MASLYIVLYKGAVTRGRVIPNSFIEATLRPPQPPKRKGGERSLSLARIEEIGITSKIAPSEKTFII